MQRRRRWLRFHLHDVALHVDVSICCRRMILSFGEQPRRARTKKRLEMTWRRCGQPRPGRTRSVTSSQSLLRYTSFSINRGQLSFE